MQKTLILHIFSADGFEFVTVKSEVAGRNKELSKGRHRRLEGRGEIVYMLGIFGQDNTANFNGRSVW